jgi:hypothetical protein
MLKFASRVGLFSESGYKICEVHREEAIRMIQNGQVIHQDRGCFVRRLVVLDHNPEQTGDRNHSNSCFSVYREVLNGGEALSLETSATLSRAVVTQPCVTFKMKSIRPSLRRFYVIADPAKKDR